MTKKKGETLAIWVERNTLEKHESDNMNVCDDYEVTKYRDCGKGKKVFDKKGMIKRCLTKKKKKRGIVGVCLCVRACVHDLESMRNRRGVGRKRWQTLGEVEHGEKERGEGEKGGRDDDDGLQAHVVLAVDHGREEPQRHEQHRKDACELCVPMLCACMRVHV